MIDFICCNTYLLWKKKPLSFLFIYKKTFYFCSLQLLLLLILPSELQITPINSIQEHITHFLRHYLLLEICLLLLSVHPLYSQLGIHNTTSSKAFVKNVIKEYITTEDVKIPFGLIYQLREIVKLGTILSAKTPVQKVIGISY